MTSSPNQRPIVRPLPILPPIYVADSSAMAIAGGMSSSTKMQTNFHSTEQPKQQFLTTSAHRREEPCSSLAKQTQRNHYLQTWSFDRILPGAAMHAFRTLSAGEATNSLLRHEQRHSTSSSSDSGVLIADLFSPNNLHTTGLNPASPNSALSVSPPGLSPLQISSDSAFSTPSSLLSAQLHSRFTFDVSQQGTSQETKPKEIYRQVEPSQTLLQLQSTKTPVFRSGSMPAVCTQSTPQFLSKLDHMLTTHAISALISPRPLYFSPKPIKNKDTAGRLFSPSLFSPVHSFEIFREKKLMEFYKSLLSNKTPVKNITASDEKLPEKMDDKKKCRKNENKSESLACNLAANREDNAKIPSILEDFSSQANLQFICRHCNKDFKRPDILSRHMRRHTGEKPFGCDLCGRTHRRTHTDEKPYACTACPYAARRRDVLTRHMSTRHHLKADRTSFKKQRRPKNVQDHAMKKVGSKRETRQMIKAEDDKQSAEVSIKKLLKNKILANAITTRVKMY